MTTTSDTTGTLTGHARAAASDAPKSRVRAVRTRRVRGDLRGALLLIAPLAVFMAVFFVAPIVNLMMRSVWDPAVATAFPATAAALHDTAAGAPPPAPVYAALAADIVAADNAGTLGDAASRLNDDLPGMRALLMSTRRHLDDASGDDGNASPAQTAPQKTSAVAQQHDLVTLDARWADPQTWRVLARAIRPTTDAYLLRALDHRRTPDGRVLPMPDGTGVYLPILGRTFSISATVAVLVLLLGYPLTYWLAGLPRRRQQYVMMAILIPFWTSILVRIAAWMVVLPREGLVNKIALSLHLIESPVDLLYNRTGVIISMVHILIPVMVLPLFAVMRGIPRTFQMAAVSLGSHPFGAFWRVYVPQTVPGIAAGVMLVFISALGYYIAPALLGGAGDQMLSYYIAYFTNTSINWGLAAALSLLLIVATVLLFNVYRLLLTWRPTTSGA